MTVEEVADHDKNGIKSAAEEKAVGGEAEAERSFAFYRPGQLARRREEEEDCERAKTQREATAAAETSACYRNARWAAATDYRRSAKLEVNLNYNVLTRCSPLPGSSCSS